MRVDRINYQKTFNLGNYTSERIGMEAEVAIDDDIDECYKILKSAAEKFHKGNNPQPEGNYQPLERVYINGLAAEAQNFESKPPFNIASLPTIDPRAYDIAEKNIDNATTIQELEFYADIAVKYELVEMYLAKKKTLQ